MKALLRLLTIALFAVVTLGSAFALDVPSLTGRVVDGAKVLTEQQKVTLEESLRVIEQKTTAQVVIVTVDTLRGEDIFEFSQKVFRVWKLGSAKKNNGILIIAAKNERQLRIHTGYGEEGPIPDAESVSIIRQTMAPFMQGKKGGFDNYFHAFEAGIARIARKIE